MTSINQATSAYANVMNQTSGADAAKPSSGPSFGDVLKSSISSAIDAQHKSEQVSAAAVTGKANMTDVLQAVNDAELALNTVLAIRDRVVQAYEQVLRTPM